MVDSINDSVTASGVSVVTADCPEAWWNVGLASVVWLSESPPSERLGESVAMVALSPPAVAEAGVTDGAANRERIADETDSFIH